MLLLGGGRPIRLGTLPSVGLTTSQVASLIPENLPLGKFTGILHPLATRLFMS